METNDNIARWQDWGNMAIGALLCLSPLFMNYPDNVPGLLWSVFGSGLAILVLAALAVYLPRAWEEGINTLLGLWLIASPWALRYANHRDIAMISIAAGIAVMVLAAWAMWIDGGFSAWRHRH